MIVNSKLSLKQKKRVIEQMKEEVRVAEMKKKQRQTT